MKYHVIKFDRDNHYKIIERLDLEARNKKDAMKEAEKIKDECGFKNINVVLYKEGNECVATFKAYAPFFL